MNCLPGTPCYRGNDVIVYTTYPRGCTSSSSSGCITYPISSDNLYYSGPNLPNTEIETQDSITEALQKIDSFVSSGSGTVTSISVETDNGFSGTVADPTTTPAITLGTTVTDNQVLYASGGALVGHTGMTYNSIVSALTVGRVLLSTVPINDDTLTQILVREGTGGEIYYRTAASLVGQWVGYGSEITALVDPSGKSFYAIQKSTPPNTSLTTKAFPVDAINDDGAGSTIGFPGDAVYVATARFTAISAASNEIFAGKVSACFKKSSLGVIAKVGSDTVEISNEDLSGSVPTAVFTVNGGGTDVSFNVSTSGNNSFMDCTLEVEGHTKV